MLDLPRLGSGDASSLVLNSEYFFIVKQICIPAVCQHMPSVHSFNSTVLADLCKVVCVCV